MTRFLFLSVLMGVLPISMEAQDDDVYFTPKKKSMTESPVRSNNQYDRPAYYNGNCRNIDEYNRRGKLKSYYQKIGTDSLGNDIIEFHNGDDYYATSNIDSTITMHSGSERYYDDADNAFEYSRRMGRFDGFYGYWDPAFYGSYWGSPYWRGYYSWYDPWGYPYYGWYGGWYDPWYYGYYGWGYPYYGWASGWYTPNWHYRYNGPTGTRNHSATIGSHSATSGNLSFGRRGTFGTTQNDIGNAESRWFGKRSNSNNDVSHQNDNGFGRRDNLQNQNQFQQRQSPIYNNNSRFGSNRGTFDRGNGFGGSRGSFGASGGNRGGFGGRR